MEEEADAVRRKRRKRKGKEKGREGGRQMMGRVAVGEFANLLKILPFCLEG